MGTFVIEKGQFLKNGRPIRVLSGSIHYFRVLPADWDDRLKKLKACGFNTVETYIPWNFHEPKRGQFEFEGEKDVCRFIELAQENGLNVILRPSPYICAEWEFGGFPAWLLKNRNISLRVSDPDYLKAVEEYYSVLLPKLAPYQITRGGPVLLCQIENEYGSYGSDKAYLRFLQELYRKNGFTIPLFTSDGGNRTMLGGGTLPDVFKTVNFGSHPKENFDALQIAQPEGPAMCAEYWNGWFDHWGEEHHTRAPEDAVNTFRDMLEMGAHGNFYMFYGGTSFGLWAGANCPDSDCTYQPTVTSYDYCAVLDEAGNPTPKFDLLRNLLKDYHSEPLPDCPPSRAAKSFGDVLFTEFSPLRGNLPLAARSAQALPMEQYDLSYGEILYQTVLPGPVEEEKLVIRGIHDRAHVFVNGKRVGIYWRNDGAAELTFPLPERENKLEILVEAMGRVNYGRFLKDEKGIVGGVYLHGYQLVSDFTVYGNDGKLPDAVYTHVSSIPDEPAYYRATFTVDAPADTYFKPYGFSKGTVWLNGFCLGRFWNEKGPQKTLYIPQSLLKAGKNELVVLEYDRAPLHAGLLQDFAEL